MSEMESNLHQRVSCVANYAYDASEPDELTIRPGDVLRDVERLPGGWWRGELRGRRGMFPDNFVSVLTDSHNARGGGVHGKCRAVFSYQPANPDELPLCVGDVLEVLGEVEEGWWQGRRMGRVGVFPSNFVVMLDPAEMTSPPENAPALPPKPVKEQCRVLFPYSAVNEDELTLEEGDVVTIVSKEAPDRGWWRGELRGRIGLFPDNFVQIIPPTVATVVEEKKPDRPPAKSTSIYPVLNKYTEKTAAVKEITTTKIGTHKENTLNKEVSLQTTVTSTSKNESEKLIHTETFVDGTADGQVKKPPVPLKKSPTPGSGVGGLFSGLKSKMIPSLTNDKEKSPPVVSSSSSSNTSGESDRVDGGASSKPDPAAHTFDRVQRDTILTDPRAHRVKAPRRRPPSQALRDDTPQQIGLSNGHEEKIEKTEKAVDKTSANEEIKPRAREWEKHKAPWMEELKLNQAKKTGDTRPLARASTHSIDNSMVSDTSSQYSQSDELITVGVNNACGETINRILECGLEEKRSSHSMEMSKSTSSITNRISVLESFEETKVRHSLDSKKETVSASKETDTQTKPPLNSPTAAGRSLISMVDEVKKMAAPSPPLASTRTELTNDKHKQEHKPTTETKPNDINKAFDRSSTLERVHKLEERREKQIEDKGVATLEREKKITFTKTEKSDGNDALIAQLNNRISNLEKLIEVQNTMFKSAIEELNIKLKQESEKRQSLQAEVEKLAHCVTQV